ncbi:MAG: BatD family protein [Candidatus Hydrogenedentota bacterium]
MKHSFAIAAVCLLAWAAPALGQEVQADVESTRVTAGKAFPVTVTAAGTRVGRPIIPHVQGLVINRTPASTSRSIQVEFRNGRSNTVEQHTWVYYATAQSPGEITLPPIQVRIDGKTYKTDPIPLTAEKQSPGGGQQRQPRSGRPGVAGRGEQGEPGAGQPRQPGSTRPQDGTQDREPTWDDVVFVESMVDKREVYQGEALTLTVRVGELNIGGVKIRGPRNVSMPESAGFYSQPVDQQETTLERNGFPYRVHVLEQQLFAMRTGRLEIGRFRFAGVARAWTNGGGLDTRQFDLDTEPIYVDVRPLPNPPKNFSGAVGRFRIVADMPQRDLEQGLPVELRLRVTGQGNPDAIGEPALPAMPWAHVSGPRKDVTGRGSGGNTLTKTFTYTLTPLEPGEYTVPPVRFVYFEPKAGGYRTDDTPPMQVRVARGELPETLPEQTATTTPEGPAQDIWSIKRNAGGLGSARGGGLASAAVLVAPPALWGVFLAFFRRQRRLQHDTRYARNYRARAKSRERLRRMETAEEPVQELYRAVTGFLADKFNVEGAGMTSRDAARLLEDAQAPPEVTQGFVKALRACERERYAKTQLSQEEVNALAHAAVAHMDSLDTHLRGGRAL